MKKELTINEVKHCQLKILEMISDFFDSNNIKYYLTAGTLIGALRHKGFIPWDDDIDLVMLRPDYEKMIKLFPQSGRYRLYCIEADDTCIYPYAKVYDTQTVLIEGDERDHPAIGVNIDIFPLDNATDNFEDALKLKKEIKLYDNILEVKRLDRVNRGIIKNVTVAILRSISKIFTYQWLVKKVIMKSKKYIDNNDSRYIVNAVIYCKGEKEILEREWFKESIELEFEGLKFKAPVGADQYMRRLFGDYMQLPPEDKRVSHHRFNAYYK